DIAMYRSKQRGPGRVTFFEERFGDETQQHHWVERDLRLAAQRHELQVHFQPRVDANSGLITSVEALLRWQHPTRGLVMPDQFIPVAEETELIVELGTWVI